MKKIVSTIALISALTCVTSCGVMTSDYDSQFDSRTTYQKTEDSERLNRLEAKVKQTEQEERDARAAAKEARLAYKAELKAQKARAKADRQAAKARSARNVADNN